MRARGRASHLVAGSQPSSRRRGCHGFRACPSGFSRPPDTHHTLASAFPAGKPSAVSPAPGPLVFLLLLHPQRRPAPHPLTPRGVPPGPCLVWICMSAGCSAAAPRWTTWPLSSMPGTAVPPLHPSTRGPQHTSPPLLPGPARLRPLNPPGLRLPLRATLNPPHKAPSSLRPAWISSSSRKPSGPADPTWGSPAQKSALRTTDSGLSPPPTSESLGAQGTVAPVP